MDIIKGAWFKELFLSTFLGSTFYTSFMEIEIIGEDFGSLSPRNSIFSRPIVGHGVRRVSGKRLPRAVHDIVLSNQRREF